MPPEPTGRGLSRHDGRDKVVLRRNTQLAPIFPVSVGQTNLTGRYSLPSAESAGKTQKICDITNIVDLHSTFWGTALVLNYRSFIISWISPVLNPTEFRSNWQGPTHLLSSPRPLFFHVLRHFWRLQARVLCTYVCVCGCVVVYVYILCRRSHSRLLCRLVGVGPTFQTQLRLNKSRH